MLDVDVPAPVGVPADVTPDVKGTLGPLVAPEKAGLPAVALALGVAVVLPGLSTLLLYCQ